MPLATSSHAVTTGPSYSRIPNKVIHYNHVIPPNQIFSTLLSWANSIS